MIPGYECENLVQERVDTIPSIFTFSLKFASLNEKHPAFSFKMITNPTSRLFLPKRTFMEFPGTAKDVQLQFKKAFKLYY